MSETGTLDGNEASSAVRADLEVTLSRSDFSAAVVNSVASKLNGFCGLADDDPLTAVYEAMVEGDSGANVYSFKSRDPEALWSVTFYVQG